MNNSKPITAKPTDFYLSDIWEKLPYGIINKGETGCGATSLPLESNDNVIVCVPFKSLINNKIVVYPNERVNYSVQRMYGGVSDSEIEEHLELEQPKKFITTYDSFLRLVDIIGDITDYHIVIDEYPELLTTYRNRQNNIEPFVDYIDTLDNVSYISATPLKSEYLPNILKNKPIYNIDWSQTAHNAEKEVIIGFTKNPKVATKNLIISHLERGYTEHNGHKADELFIFINSVNFIVDVIKSMELHPELFKIMCGVSTKNAEKLKLVNAEINTDFKDNRKINFLTSTAFLGCDFQSNNGLKVIVTDVRKKYSMLDINTQILQIDGRIRTLTNPFNNTIIHITNLKSEDWKEDTLEIINDYYKDSVDIVRSYGGVVGAAKKLFSDIVKENQYYLKYDAKTDTIKIDDIKYKADFMKESTFTIKYISKDELIKEYESEGVKHQTFFLKHSDTITSYIKDKKKADYYEMYDTFKDDWYNYTKLLIDAEVRAYDKQIPEEVDTLGIAKIRALRYNKLKIRNEFIFESETFKQAVYEELREQLTDKEYYTSEEIKDSLNQIYKQLTIKKNAKATDITRYVIATKKKVKTKYVYFLELDKKSF